MNDIARYALRVFVALVLVLTIGGIALASAESSYTFNVSGVLRALPGNGRAQNEIIVKHERISVYRDSAGQIVGMMAMTMPFYLAPTTSIEGLKVGDKVQLVVEQTFEPKESEFVVAIKKVD